MMNFKIMKRFFSFTLVVGLIFSAISVNAQQNPSQLFDKVIGKISAYDNIRFDFSYRMINEKAGIDEVQSGILYLKGDAYRLEMDEQLIISDSKVVWTYLRDSDEVMINDASGDPDAITPSSLLTSYAKDYKTSFVNNSKDGGAGLKVIELNSNKNKNLTSIQVVINEAELMVKKLIIPDNGGNTFVYDLSKMKANNQLASDFFRFDAKKYPGVEVIDMR